MDGLFVRGGSPVRVYFDPSHIPHITVQRLACDVGRGNGTVADQAGDCDVLVVDPAHPWSFHELLQSKHPEKRPPVVLGFWVPLCITAKELVWFGHPHWEHVILPYERLAYPRVPLGILVYGSFLAGRHSAHLVPPDTLGAHAPKLMAEAVSDAAQLAARSPSPENTPQDSPQRGDTVESDREKDIASSTLDKPYVLRPVALSDEAGLQPAPVTIESKNISQTSDVTPAVHKTPMEPPYESGKLASTPSASLSSAPVVLPNVTTSSLEGKTPPGHPNAGNLELPTTAAASQGTDSISGHDVARSTTFGANLIAVAAHDAPPRAPASTHTNALPPVSEDRHDTLDDIPVPSATPDLPLPSNNTLTPSVTSAGPLGIRASPSERALPSISRNMKPRASGLKLASKGFVPAWRGPGDRLNRAPKNQHPSQNQGPVPFESNGTNSPKDLEPANSKIQMRQSSSLSSDYRSSSPMSNAISASPLEPETPGSTGHGSNHPQSMVAQLKNSTTNASSRDDNTTIHSTLANRTDTLHRIATTPDISTTKNDRPGSTGSFPRDAATATLPSSPLTDEEPNSPENERVEQSNSTTKHSVTNHTPSMSLSTKQRYLNASNRAFTFDGTKLASANLGAPPSNGLTFASVDQSRSVPAVSTSTSRALVESTAATNAKTTSDYTGRTISALREPNSSSSRPSNLARKTNAVSSAVKASSTIFNAPTHPTSVASGVRFRLPIPASLKILRIPGDSIEENNRIPSTSNRSAGTTTQTQKSSIAAGLRTKDKPERHVRIVTSSSFDSGTNESLDSESQSSGSTESSHPQFNSASRNEFSTSSTRPTVPTTRAPPLPVLAPDQINVTKSRWTEADDQYIIDYMNWIFKQNPKEYPSDIIKDIAQQLPHHSLEAWQKHFTSYEATKFIHHVPVLYDRFNKRTSAVDPRGNSKPLLPISLTPDPVPAEPADEPRPKPPVPTLEQLNSKIPKWTQEEDQFVIDYMNWWFKQDPEASTEEIIDDIALQIPHHNQKAWRSRFRTYEDSTYMRGVPVLFQRLTNRKSGVGSESKQGITPLTHAQTRKRKRVGYSELSDDDDLVLISLSEDEYGDIMPRKRTRHQRRRHTRMTM